VKEPKNWNK